jgi:hypothetical protein
MAFIAIFHLIAFLVKLAVLAAFYSIVPLLIIYGPRKLRERFEGLSGNSLAITLYLIAFIGLLIYSGSFWGDRGFYDSSRIPVSDGTEIICTDGDFTYIPIGREQRLIGSFALHDGKIFAEDQFTTSTDSVPSDSYLIFNPGTQELKQFASKDEYEKFAAQHNYPDVSAFREFFDHYNDYWNGWRFCLLP